MCHKGEGATNREVVQQCVIRERGGAVCHKGEREQQIER